MTQGEYSMSQLGQWLGDIRANLPKALAGSQYTLIWSGLKHDENRVSVGVMNSGAKGMVEAELGRLRNPLGAVSLEWVQAVQLDTHKTVEDDFDPLIGGIEISSPAFNGGD